MNRDEAIFAAAASLTAAGRAAYLDEACAGQPELRARVEALLRSHEARGFMDGDETVERSPDFATEPVQPPVEEDSGRIGRYQLLEPIGEGGFGIVWMAEQAEPVTRRVALKIIKAGMDTREVIARFEAERQALAMMDHPCIAKVFDAGATSTGRPYFVMELVSGIPITNFCDEQEYGTRQRLELFAEVCSAINHAHQKGIIHRDIKPTNILVTLDSDRPVPKVIDFGIAKATGSRLTNRTFFTRFEHFVGTPAYMSPEQTALSGLDIDTRSDIYSLGIVLYELLTGKPPFDPKTLLSAGYDEMRRIIREVEPKKPSTRLSSVAGAERSTLAKSHRVSPEKVRVLVEKDLDWIVMKAIEKDRSRRYETANGLALDIRRFLADRPVSAGPPTAGYRFKKFARRNRTALAGGVAIAGILVAATAVSTLQAFRATRAEREQRRLREEAEIARAGESAQKELAARSAKEAGEAVTRLEIEKAEFLFASDNAGEALAYLARLLRRQPNNLAVAERLLCALSQRNFCLPAGPPLEHELAETDAAPDQDEHQIPEFARTQNPVRAGEFNSDGTKIVTAGRDGTARLWDAASGLPLCAPLRHDDAVLSARFSPDGQRVITASRDRTARIWDARSGQPLLPSLVHDDIVLFAVFSPDGAKSATACLDRTIRFWDVQTGKPVGRIIQTPAPVFSVSFSPDGVRLLAAAVDARAHLIDADSGEVLATWDHQSQYARNSNPSPQFSPDATRVSTVCTFHGHVWSALSPEKPMTQFNHGGEMAMAAFGPDGSLVATASHDNTARLWDTGRGGAFTPPLKHEQWVDFVDFSPDGQRLATASKDRTARVWDVRSGRPLTEPLRHDGHVYAAKFNPDANRLLTISSGKRAWLWELKHAQSVGLSLLHATPVRHAVFSFEGSKAATATGGGMVRIWNTRTGKALTEPFRHDGYVEKVQFSPDGMRLLSVTTQGTAQVWDAATGRPAAPRLRARTKFHEAQFSPDGQQVISVDDDGVAALWSTETSELLREMKHAGPVYSAAFSPNGKRVVTASGDKTAMIWDASTGVPLCDPLRHPDSVDLVVFSHDGNRIATASLREKAVRIWDGHSGRQLVPALIHADEIYRKNSIAFSFDDSRLATVAGSAAQVWDVSTGQTVTPPLRHPGRVNSVRFSPDGRRLVTACYDGTVRVFDVATGHALSEPLRHGDKVSYAEFSPDGTRVITAPSDGTARIWDLPQVVLPVPDWLPDLAESVAGQRIDDRDTSTIVPVAELFRLREKLKATNSQDPYSVWAQWFFSSGSNRPMSPHSSLALADIAGQWIEQDTLESLSEAVRAMPTNALALARLARRILELKPDDYPRREIESDFLSRRALVMAPADSEVKSIRDEIAARLRTSGDQPESRMSIKH